MNREVFYPPVGIVHITKDISDLIRYKLNNQERIIINTSAQPNSSPHLGTITTIMSAFALAKHFKEEFDIPVEVQFDALENSPADTKEINNKLYYTDQKHTYLENGISKEESNMKRFKEILKMISDYSNIDYSIRTYYEYQKNKYVREAVIKIFNDKDYFSKLLAPTSNLLHVRGICPECGLGLKKIDNLVEEHDSNHLVLYEECPIHGKYVVNVRADNDDYVDINTQFRDITKGYELVSEDKDNNTLSIMLDGGDWAGIWSQRIHTEGLVRLGLYEFPIRLYAPVILDWSGAKFSKSLYLASDAYKNINRAFINYDNFIDVYGYEGLEKLWNEVYSWVEEPKKFFRNYSVDYFDMIMKEDEE